MELHFAQIINYVRTWIYYALPNGTAFSTTKQEKASKTHATIYETNLFRYTAYT